MGQHGIKKLITAIAVVLAVAHQFIPDFAIDTVTLTLLAIAVVPWLIPLLRSVELPGGVRLELRDVERLEEKGEEVGLFSSEHEAGKAEAREYPFMWVAGSDPNLALAGLRIEIEKKLRDLALARGLELRRGGIGVLLRALRREELLSEQTGAFIDDMVGVLNQAVHGAQVDQDVADWVLDYGPQVLDALDHEIAKESAGSAG